MTQSVTSPSLDIKQWHMIDSFMVNDHINPLKTAVENACQSDGSWLSDTMDFLMPDWMSQALDAPIRLFDALVPGDQVNFPDIVKADGTVLVSNGPHQMATNARDAFQSFEQEAKRLADEVLTLWETEYQPYSSAPKKLHDVGTSWHDIATSMAEIPTGIAEAQQIQGWSGEGAEAYARVVPHQSAASQQTGELATASGNVLNNASRGLQGLYLSFAAQLAQAKASIEGYEVQGIEKTWGWFCNTAPRARQATAVLEAVLDYLRNDLPTNETYWASNVDEASTILTDNESVDRDVFVGGKWPASEAEKLGKLEQGGGGMPTFQQPQMPTPTPTQTPMPEPTTGMPVQGQDTTRTDDIDQYAAGPGVSQ